MDGPKDVDAADGAQCGPDDQEGAKSMKINSNDVLFLSGSMT
jgi:hypothetical protein